FQAEDGIRDFHVTGVQTCALPILLGILLGYPLFRAYYLSGNKWINYLLDYLYVCIAAQLFTLPLSLYYFGQFPNYFLLANLFIALPSTIIMYIGVFLSILPFDSLNVVLGRILEFSLIFMMEGVKSIESLCSLLYSSLLWYLYDMLLHLLERHKKPLLLFTM